MLWEQQLKKKKTSIRVSVKQLDYSLSISMRDS